MTHTPERDAAMVAFAETLPTYLAFSETLQLVKVGFSTNVRQRLASIPSDRRDAGKMALIGWAHGGPALEAELHDRFAVAHERGEWFHPHPSMADFIEEECEAGDPPIIANAEFRISTRGYWAARGRLGATEESERVVFTFPDGRAFRTREVIVPNDAGALFRHRVLAGDPERVA